MHYNKNPIISLSVWTRKEARVLQNIKLKRRARKMSHGWVKRISTYPWNKSNILLLFLIFSFSKSIATGHYTEMYVYQRTFGWVADIVVIRYLLTWKCTSSTTPNIPQSICVFVCRSSSFCFYLTVVNGDTI